MSYFARKKRQWQESAWLLGICLNGFEDLKNGCIHWVDNGKYKGNKWFADPFILDYDDQKIYLLVEEFDYKVHRGRIAKLTIDRNRWIVSDCKILLDLPTHLSFPMIWREGEKIYVCPENYASGGWNMYCYDATSERLDKVFQIIDEKLTDAILYHEGNDYWILSTYEPIPNGPDLTIWHSSSLKGSYNEVQRVSFHENVGRNAGSFFHYDGKLIRPAQESNCSYGHSILFQEAKLENGLFGFRKYYTFHSPHPIYDAGTHTYNQYQELAVIDVKGYRYRIAAKIFEFISGLLLKTGIKHPYYNQVSA